MKTKTSLMILIGIFLLGSLSLTAQTKLSGTEIMQKVSDRADGDEMEGTLTMTLINASGGERVREIKQYIKDFGTVEKKIMFFLQPADVKNTSFMNWSYADETKNDDQWIYLPALKKVKRISSDSSGDYFMGSDFTYDDLGDRKVGDDTHTLLRTETLEGLECYVIESVTKNKDYMYSKTTTWVVKDRWYGLKKEFYDEDGEYLKSLTLLNVEQINGFWIITGTEMKNAQKDHTTRMEFKGVKVDAGIDEANFSERMMKRGL
ncbi:MAG: outer membrane lipoprotein-sorting protein [Candidatus Marinimicrobia bacterium]|nr:outer membrane lipoprotein-sorting protein [Candidatus Neomarinimicrobiota bacterium]